MLRCFLVCMFAYLLAYLPACADDGRYGSLDLSRLTQGQLARLYDRLSLMAFEESLLVYCKKPDDFEKRVRASLQSCLTEDTWKKVERYYQDKLRNSLANLSRKQDSCEKSPDIRAIAWLGINVVVVAQKLPPVYGIEVMSMQIANAPAARAGVKVGDVIVSINGRAVRDGSAYDGVMSALKPGANVSIVVIRNNTKITLWGNTSELTVNSKGQFVLDIPHFLPKAPGFLNDNLYQAIAVCHRCSDTILSVFCR